MRVHNIGLQRTSRRWRAAAEAGSFGPTTGRIATLLVVGAIACLSMRANGQVPAWAEEREFELKDVEMSLTRPSGGYTTLSADGKVIDASNYFQGFTVTVFGDGRVIRSDDTNNGPETRTVERELPREAIYTLLDRFIRARFFDLPAEYNGGATIGPWLPRLFKNPPAHFHLRKAHTVMDGTFVRLRLKVSDHEKVITDWNDEGPKELDGIATALEDVGGVHNRAK